MAKATKRTAGKKKVAVKKTAQTAQLPKGMAHATEREIKQWIIREFRMMDYDAEVSNIHLERYPLRIPNWRLLRITADSDLVRRFMLDGPHEKLRSGLYLIDKKPT